MRSRQPAAAWRPRPESVAILNRKGRREPIGIRGGFESERLALLAWNPHLGAGKAGSEAGRATAAGFDAATASINAAAGSLDAFSSAATKVRNANVKSVLQDNQYDADGFAVDSNGQRITGTAQANVGPGQTFDAKQFARDAAQQALIGGRPLDPQRYVRDTGGSAVIPTRTPADAVPQGTPVAPDRTQPEAKPAGGAASTVNIVLNGRRTGVEMASPKDAAALTGVLRELAEAATRAAA